MPFLKRPQCLEAEAAVEVATVTVARPDRPHDAMQLRGNDAASNVLIRPMMAVLTIL